MSPCYAELVKGAIIDVPDETHIVLQRDDTGELIYVVVNMSVHQNNTGQKISTDIYPRGNALFVLEEPSPKASLGSAFNAHTFVGDVLSQKGVHMALFRNKNGFLEQLTLPAEGGSFILPSKLGKNYFISSCLFYKVRNLYRCGNKEVLPAGYKTGTLVSMNGVDGHAKMWSFFQNIFHLKYL